LFKDKNKPVHTVDLNQTLHREVHYFVIPCERKI